MARLTLLFAFVTLALLGLFQNAAATTACALDKRYTYQQVVAKLGLEANPEKGYYKQTFEDTLLLNRGNGTRSASTAIYYLLEGTAGQGLWHRIDAVEVWHYYAGAPLTLSLSYNNGTGVRKVVLGPDVFKGQQPQVVIGSWEWQAAQSLGDWTLVGTTVAPAFDPNLYEIANATWTPK